MRGPDRSHPLEIAFGSPELDSTRSGAFPGNADVTS
jgi:hypothetical protein